jgi:hypothetical protein
MEILMNTVPVLKTNLNETEPADGENRKAKWQFLKGSVFQYFFLSALSEKDYIMAETPTNISCYSIVTVPYHSCKALLLTKLEP